MRALKRELTGEDESGTAFGLDGRRPLRPFRLSVLTTAEHEEKQETILSFISSIGITSILMSDIKCGFKI